MLVLELVEVIYLQLLLIMNKMILIHYNLVVMDLIKINKYLIHKLLKIILLDKLISNNNNKIISNNNYNNNKIRV